MQKKEPNMRINKVLELAQDTRSRGQNSSRSALSARSGYSASQVMKQTVKTLDNLSGKARLASAMRNININNLNSNATTAKATVTGVKFLDLELMSHK